MRTLRFNSLLTKFAFNYDMPNYRRLRTPGALIFFTVNLAERGSDLLVREIERLRIAFRNEAKSHPFTIHDIVVLPNHLHAIWSLPGNDWIVSREVV